MKAIHRIAGLLLFLVLVALGAGVAQAALRGGAVWSTWLEQAETYRLAVAAVGIGCVLVALLWALSTLPSGRGGRFLSFENPGGEVQVSLDAIRDYLARMNADFPGVVRIQPEVRSVRGELVISMGCEVRAGSAIPDLAQQVQERVRERIVNGVGLSAIRTIRVVVRQIVDAGRPAGPARRSGEMPADPSEATVTPPSEEMEKVQEGDRLP